MVAMGRVAAVLVASLVAADAFCQPVSTRVDTGWQNASAATKEATNTAATRPIATIVRAL